MNNMHRVSISPKKFVKTLIAADRAWAKSIIEAVKEQLGDDPKLKTSTNKPFGRGKETGEAGAHCSAFLATSREDGTVLTSYSEAKRRAPDSSPAEEGKEYVFINLRAQKGQAATSGVDAAALAEVMALAEAPLGEDEVAAAVEDVDAAIEALLG
jgi:hypothetical protein